MTRIVVVGNSQVGALKTGWDAIRGRHPGIDVEFFGVPKGNFHRFALDPARRLALPPALAASHPGLVGVVERINGRATADLGNADFVLRTGNSRIARAAVAILASFDIDGLREVGAARRMSRPAFDGCVGDIVRAAAPPEEWRGWTRPRLTFLPSPMPSEAIVDAADDDTQRWRKLQARPDGVLDAFHRVFDALATELGAHRIDVLRQPRATLAASGLTKATFGLGSTSLDGRTRGDRDVRHMNADYGALCLEAYLAQIGATARAPAAATL